jgi:hypothetical protein
MKNIENLNDIFNINPMDETENTNLPSIPENLNATKFLNKNLVISYSNISFNLSLTINKAFCKYFLI